MEPVRKSRLAEMVVERLRAAIGSGQWKDHLPGSRMLCRFFQVSPPTLAEAVRLLCEEGVLQKDGPRRRLRIAASRSVRVTGGKRRRKLLCLAPDPLWAVQPLWTSLQGRLIERLEPEGWEVKRRVMVYTTQKTPSVRWEQLFALEEPDAIMAVVGTPALAAWAVERGQRMIFVGGNPGPSPIPRVYVRTRPLVRQAVLRLLKAGHRRICMPLAGRQEFYQKEMREEMALGMTAAGIPYRQDWHTPATSYEGRDAFLSLLGRVWQEFRPTAVVLLDWHEAVALSCFLAERGLTIPRHISVVVLSYSPEMEWFSPALSCYHYPVRRLTTLLERWVLGGHPDLATAFDHGLPATWRPGATIAGPPHGS